MFQSSQIQPKGSFTRKLSHLKFKLLMGLNAPTITTNKTCAQCFTIKAKSVFINSSLTGSHVLPVHVPGLVVQSQEGHR